MKSAFFILFSGIILPLLAFSLAQPYLLTNDTNQQIPVYDSVSAIKKASKSVVAIHVTKNQPRETQGRRRNIFRFSQQVTSSGSGVIIDYAKGHVVTNFHVIDQARKIIVELSNGRSIEGDVIGTDSVTDIALVALREFDNLPRPGITIGRSEDIEVGQELFAVGNPYGADQAVTRGIFSGKSNTSSNPYIKLMQTDARIFLGNSGGALIDGQGRLVGITSGYLSSRDGETGLGLAIPIELVKRITDDLDLRGKVNRGWIGSFSVKQLSPTIMQQLSGGTYSIGLQVRGMRDDTPLGISEMKPGDIIIGIDREIASLSNLENRLISLLPFDSLIMSVLRFVEGVYIKIEIHVIAIDPSSQAS